MRSSYCLLAAAALIPGLWADSIAVRQVEGAVHGFLTLSNLDGSVIASGDSTQTNHGGQVTNRLTFHFKDGSLQDETVVFSQRGHFRVLSDHLVQKGPAFKRPLDLSINGSTGLATVNYTDAEGKDKTESAHLKLPPDLANGMVPILLRNLPAGSQTVTLSMVVATPKPVLVKLAISAAGQDSFSIAGAGYKATCYVIKVDLGGIRGVIAPLIGKEPPDTRVWILGNSGF